jgi:hypothetical protein
MKLEGSGERDSHRRRGGHRVTHDKADQRRERSMSGAMDVSSGLLRRGLARTAGFLAFWLILARFDPATFLVGALAAVIATRLRWQTSRFASWVNRLGRESMLPGVLWIPDCRYGRVS